MSNSLWPHERYSPWNSPGQNTGVGSLSLLQGIFPSHGSNPGLLHCRWILYQLSHQRSPRILEWVAYPYSSRSFQPGNQTGVSCIAGIFFTNWAMREAPRGWDGFIESPTQRTWICANSGRQQRTGKPGMLQSMGSQRIGHNSDRISWGKNILEVVELLHQKTH